MRQKLYSPERMREILRRALEGGAVRIDVMRWRWDISADCEAPVIRELLSAHMPILATGEVRERSWAPGEYIGQAIEFHTRCRRCVACLKARSALWSIRARDEIANSSRTWFGTLTINMQQRYLFLLRYEQKFGRLVMDDARFRAIHHEASLEATKYIKRIRKESGAKIRYLLVAERHADGDPHYHMLVHERLGQGVVRERTLSSQWQLGFCKWRLAEGKNPGSYLAKYLSKSAQARVRASVRYGDDLYNSAA